MESLWRVAFRKTFSGRFQEMLTIRLVSISLNLIETSGFLTRFPCPYPPTVLLPALYDISCILQGLKCLLKVDFLCEDIVRVIGRDGKYTDPVLRQDL